MRPAAIIATIILAAAAIAPAPPAMAGMPVPVEKTCPVGGETFTFTTTASYSTFGARPDGKPYGSWTFPLELPVCPGNGLVIFQQDYSEEDKAKLAVLIADPEYKAMADRDTTYYRAAWLMKRLDRDALPIASMMLQASWQADGKPALKRRYQAEFAAMAEAIVKDKDDFVSLSFAGRAANARRELGQFEAAAALLDALPIASLTTIIPAEERQGDVVTNGDAIEEARGRRGLQTYLTGLKDLVAARNASAEPVALLPPRIAEERCKEIATLGDDDRAACSLRPAEMVTPSP